jgi:hypothetical protein
LFFTGLALFRARFVAYPEILTVLVSVTLISMVLPKFDRISRASHRSWARAAFLSVLITGSMFLGFAFRVAGAEGTAGTEDSPAAECPITEIAGLLTRPEFFGKEPQTIAAHMDFGPEILFRTNHRVLGTPYHRNAEGILALFSLMESSDPEEARRLAEGRGVGLILVCPAHSWIYSGGATGEPSESTLHNTLSAGQMPDWLQPVLLPEGAAGDFLLFRVRREAGRNETAEREAATSTRGTSAPR